MTGTSSGAESPAPVDPTAPYAGFEGTVGKIFSTSEPHWPQPPTAPEGAPNVIVMMADDLGYSDLGCYGAEIDTPELDRLAADGLRYTDFHVNPMCSPTRASLLTGLNHHMAGMATVPHGDPGFPGYAFELRDNAAIISEAFRDSGWATFMLGKWHLTKDSHLSDGAPKASWPLQRGFDRYYGILDAFTNFHQPHRLYADNHHLDIDDYPDDYFFSDDLTDQAVRMVDELRSSHPTRPFFMYFAHGAVHAPLQAPAADIERFRGCFDEGWDVLRDRRFDRQRELGVVPPDAVLPPRNTEERHEVGPWDELDDRSKKLFARYMEVYAGMVHNVDRNFGRLRRHLEAIGEWDNTIVLFTSDNGGSREGQYTGTSAYFRTLLTQLWDTDLEGVDADYGRIDLLGGPRTLAHYPMGWAMVSCTPFRLYKINTHRGGHSVPLIVNWPARFRAAGEGMAGGIRTQYQHVTDVFPTLAELCGVEVPTTRHGVAAPEPAGASFAATLGDPSAPSTHPEQYYEMLGHRGYYRDGWSVVACHRPRRPFSQDRWELHNLAEDPTESVDLAGEHPEKLDELMQAWDRAAWANQVFPLDEGNALLRILRPPWYAEWATSTTLRPGTPTLERWRSQQLIFQKSFDVDVALQWRPGDAGVLVAHGDQGGGYMLYVEDDRLFLAHNAYGDMTVLDCGRLADGASAVSLAMENPGSLKWNASVSVDGETAAEAPGLVSLMAMAPFEGIDVGIDRRSPVSWDVYERHGPFPYTGDLASVTYHPGEMAPDAGALWLDYIKANGTRYE
ncbi:MAG: arylsulfatase [Acidimicrobiaceae bacterium]|nr:arylsulfatase [Acidimicrobiaceae bacterium]